MSSCHPSRRSGGGAVADGSDPLLADGGEESQCGWLKDRYGLSWQVVPKDLGRIFSDDDPARRDRAMAAMLQMVKLDIAALEAAADAEPAAAG